MIATKLPLASKVASEPLWIPDPNAMDLNSLHRTDYKGHYHTTKVPGPSSLIATSKKSKVSAYLSTLPLSPPLDYPSGKSGEKWLDKSFQSKDVKWRRGNSIKIPNEIFDPVTNYQTFFTEKKPESITNYQPKHIPLQAPEKFNSISTYTNDYLTRSIYPSNDSLRYNLLARPSNDVIAWTNPAATYHTHNMALYERRQRNLPPLEHQTTYRTQFQYDQQSFNENRGNLTNRDSPCKSTNQIVGVGPIIPFNCTSNYQDEYREKLAQMSQSPASQLHNTSVGLLQREIEAGAQFNLDSYRERNTNMFYRVPVEP